VSEPKLHELATVSRRSHEHPPCTTLVLDATALGRIRVSPSASYPGVWPRYFTPQAQPPPPAISRQPRARPDPALHLISRARTPQRPNRWACHSPKHPRTQTLSGPGLPPGQFPPNRGLLCAALTERGRRAFSSG
jgi:hypothetical protein